MIQNGLPKFDLNDISLVPTVFSTIDSRDEIDILTDKYYRLIVAPMDTVISGFGNSKNTQTFHLNHLNMAVPRLADYSEEELNSSAKHQFLSVSLQQFQALIIDADILDKKKIHYILIDIAQGHLKSLYDAAVAGKKKYKENLVLMIGNIANPATFEAYYGVVDYVRLGIGNGFACSTSINTGINMPMGSLIEECKLIKNGKRVAYHNYHLDTQIVADGGFRSYSDIIKAYALGADYVMVGSMIAKSTLASPLGGMQDEYGDFVSEHGAKLMLENKEKVFKTYRGMSTQEVQKSLGKEKLRASEGFVHTVEVQYTFEDWLFNYQSYLKSAMSYMGFRTINELIDRGHDRIVTITPNSSERFNVKK